MSGQSPALASVIARHDRFWRHQPTDRHISRVLDFVPLKTNPDVPLRGGRFAREGDPIVPDDLDLDRMLATWPAPEEALDGDYIRERPPYGLCWMEGLMGSSVRAASGSIWAEPPGLDWSRVADLRARISDENPWYAKLREYYGRLSADTAGRVPLTQPLMRGSIDIVHSLCGSEELALAGHDHPGELDAALEIAADAFIAIGKLITESVPLWQGGRSNFGMLCPGSVVRMQADHSALISPTEYAARFLPHERRISEAFDYTIFHLHSGNMHTLDALLSMPRLTAIEVCLDPWPFAPRLRDLLPRIAEIQAAGKSLLLDGGPVSRDELDEALSRLPARGLAINVRIGSTWD